MKHTEQRCPSCGSYEIDKWHTPIYTTIFYHCHMCGYRWERPSMPTLSQYYPIELLERVQYLKDGIKLTKQDKYDLQIDLWQYGRR